MNKEVKYINPILFAISQDHGDQTPVIMLAIPTAAWEYMKDGKTHTFDLTKAGLPVRLLLFGGKDRKSLEKILLEDLAKQGINVQDRSGEDFSI